MNTDTQEILERLVTTERIIMNKDPQSPKIKAVYADPFVQARIDRRERLGNCPHKKYMGFYNVRCGHPARPLKSDGTFRDCLCGDCPII